MTAQAKNQLFEFVKWLLIPALTAIVTAAYAVGTFKGDFSRLDDKVVANRSHAEQSLANAVSVRKAEMEARIIPVETAYKTQGEALRELVSLARENAKGNEQVLVRIAKIEGKLDAYGEKLTDHIHKGK